MSFTPARTSIAAVLACLALSGCLRGKDDEEAPAAPARAWAFVNEDDRDTAAPKLERLASLLSSARRVLPEEAVAEGADPLASPSRCATPIDAFFLHAPPSPPVRGYALAAGSGCDAALVDLRSKLRAALGTAARAEFLTRAVAPNAIYCGLRVEDLAPTRGLAAIGLRFTAIDLPAAARYQEETLAGSAATTVATQTRVIGGCAMKNGDCGALPQGVTGYAVEGKSELTAALEARTIEIASAFDLAFELTHAAASGPQAGGLAGTLTSRISLSGLGEGEAARAKEHVELVLEAAGGAPFAATEGERRMVVDLEIIERDEGRRLVRGDVFAGDGTPVQAPFALMLTPHESGCVATSLDPGAALVESELAEATGSNPGPTKPLEAETLVGDWDQACASGALGRFGELTSYAETVSFGAPDAAGTARYTHRLTPFTDRECFGGHEAAVLELVGTYIVSPSPVPAVDLELDYEYAELSVTLIDATTVGKFNAGSVCGHRDWEQNKTFRFRAGECYFDLGAAAMMGLSTLRRTREFSGVRAERARLAAFGRPDGESGDSAELRAVPAAGRGRRFLKR